MSLAGIMREQEYHEQQENDVDAPISSPQHEESIQPVADTRSSHRNNRRRRRSTKVIRRTTKINHEVYVRPGKRIYVFY